MTRRNVLLDLDETCISGQYTHDIDFEKDKEQLLKFPIFHNMENEYLIFERPHLQEFLTWLFENCHVSVWTAASKDYALFIIENCILKNPENTPERHLDYCFWESHGIVSKRKYNKEHKKIDLLCDHFKLPGYKKNNTLIIDDNKRVTRHQFDNSIEIKEFDSIIKNSENDSELLDMKNQINEKFKKLEEKYKFDNLDDDSDNDDNEELIKENNRKIYLDNERKLNQVNQIIKINESEDESEDENETDEEDEENKVNKFSFNDQYINHSENEFNKDDLLDSIKSVSITDKLESKSDEIQELKEQTDNLEDKQNDIIKKSNSFDTDNEIIEN